MVDSRFSHIETLVVKVTHRCNLDCSYCYENITRKGEDMSVETFRDLVDRALLSSSKSEITFLFHGGEPTLLPVEWYEECLSYATDIGMKYNKRVRFSIQTNLLSISVTRIEHFKKYKIQPGISLDGSIYNTQSERGREDRVFQHFLRLKAEGIACGILSTINHSNYNRFSELCQFLNQEAGVRSFKANVVTPVGRGQGQVPLTADKIHEAEVDILEYMIASKGALRENNLMLELERFFKGEETTNSTKSSLCHEKTCGAGSKVLGVTPDGNLLPCGRFQWDDADYFLGNIQEQDFSFPELVSRFHAAVPENWYDCNSCEARSICRFGCQAFILRSKEKANIDCLPTKMRFRYFTENRERLRFLIETKKESLFNAPNFMYSFSSNTVVSNPFRA